MTQFFREVERVLKPKGVLAVWSYGFFAIEPESGESIKQELLDPIDPLWAEGNRQVMNGYRHLIASIQGNPHTRFSMQMEWTLGQLSAYLQTWSAELGVDPVTKMESTLRPIWGEPEKSKIVTMPLFLRAGRRPD